MNSSNSKQVCVVLLLLLSNIIMMAMNVLGGSESWCVARSDASYNALQTALDYACGAGADCLPLQPDGLCFLPNTIQAHASYAFNSYYQKSSRAPGSCDFSGYGSCVYPSSSSSSGTGGPNTPTTSAPMTNPNVPSSTTTSSPIFGGLSPGMNTPFTDNSKAPSKELASWFLIFFSSLLILSIIS
ncbi:PLASMODESMATA CALLOSE-BINDING PROTEIN 1-like isoform X2 [Cicer arietinum]|uniref:PLASMODESMATA CALLOSE-BINDING PROTEIN 3-like isoform X1 n=1 Tax=Cicer arietinum TaxID=3827 RepID=A0A1S3EA69_CICAR|nr:PLASMODESMATA CALLOSE-BINDING PROTEIN 3-like isoform X1 [Cicer arietinum]